MDAVQAYDSSWVKRIREDFPILSQQINGYPLAYLDNAATTQKPRQVIEAMNRYYEQDNANIHRAVHSLSVRATEQFEAVREKVARFIGAPHARSCIFVRGTTEAINLVANSYGLTQLNPGDEVLITHMEHHANIVPWQMVCQKTGALLKVAPINDKGELILESFAALLSERTKIVAINYASNALGTINPVHKMIELAHRAGAKVLVDGAQAIAHLPVDVKALDADFFVFSAHKMYGPTGVGVLWAKEALLEDMPPYQGGGDMIRMVTFEKTEYAPIPNKFEAGTPDIAGVIGLGAALDYLLETDLNTIHAVEDFLLDYAQTSLQQLGGYRIVGEARQKVPVISFVHARIHPHDIGTILDNEGIAVRSGHHCAMPVMDFFDVPATTRASFSFYNTVEEVDRLIAALKKVEQLFG